MSDGVWGVVGTIVGGGISLLATWITNKRNKYENTIREVRASVDKMLELAIQHPFLEDDDLCRGYPDSMSPEQRLRYKSYCCLVFNTLSRLLKANKYNAKKTKDFLGTDEIFITHHSWWADDTDNNAYDKQLKDFVNAEMGRLKQEKKIK